MGLLDQFLDPETMSALQQFSQPSAEQKKQALSMALLQGGLAGLANNRGMNGRQALFNSLSAGGLNGINAYQGNIDAMQKDQMQSLQMGVTLNRLQQEELQRKAQQEAIAKLPPDVQQAIAAGVPYKDIYKINNPEKKWESGFDANGRPVKGWAGPNGFEQVGGAEAKPIHWSDVGGKLVGTDPYTGFPNGSSIAKTVSPDSAASNALGWANFNLSKQNANAPTFNADAGGWIYKPTRDNPTGQVVTIPGLPGKPLTEFQGKSSGFASRMAAAEKILNDPSTIEMPTAAEDVAGSIPLVGKYAANVARPSGRQEYYQAQQDWVRAKLRLESGASIAPEEMDAEIRTYFPVQGDSKEVIAQKAVARKTALDATAKQAGPQFKTPEAPKPRSKQVSLDDGSKVIASLGGDGNYYVTKGGKKYRVEE